MTQNRYLLCALITILFVGCNQDAVGSSEIKVLVFSKTTGYHHESIESGVKALQLLAKEYGIQLDATEDAVVFNIGNLMKYSAVIFLSTTGDVLDDAQQQAFTEFIRAGGGFVGIHSASNTELDWPWYGQLIGGYFNSHPYNPSVREGTILVVDSNHPATSTLPNPWVHMDEWYNMRDMQGSVNILLSINEHSYKRADENPLQIPHPIAWFHEYDGGRSFYTALGHTKASYKNPFFLNHIWGGLRSVLGEKRRDLSRN